MPTVSRTPSPMEDGPHIMEAVHLSFIRRISSFENITLSSESQPVSGSVVPGNSGHSNATTGVETNHGQASSIRERHPRNHSPGPRTSPPPSAIEKIPKYITDYPLMGFLSGLLCYIGSLKPLSYIEKSTTALPLNGVNPIYQPAGFYIWILQVNTLMYDVATYDHTKPHSRSPFYEKGRLFAIAAYGTAAILEYLIRSWLGQTNPEQAAARYVADKTFESAGILFAIYEWRKYLNGRKNILPQTQSAGTVQQYLYWLPIIYMLAFGIGRALETHIDTYTRPLESKHYKLVWRGVIPLEWRPISAVIGTLFGILTSSGSLKNRFVEGCIKIVWMSNFFLHCGIFGTVTPLRLTDSDPRSLAQWLPFALALTATAGVYWRELANLPAATIKSARNLFRWGNE
jgi:hypothetical protein